MHACSLGLNSSRCLLPTCGSLLCAAPIEHSAYSWPVTQAMCHHRCNGTARTGIQLWCSSCTTCSCSSPCSQTECSAADHAHAEEEA